MPQMPEAVVHVIDDDEAIRESLAFLLEAAGMKAITYDSAESFLADLDHMTLGCIVSDLRMPGLSGLDLVQRLKADGRDIPVILITGHGDVPLAVEAMKAGVADFIEKPFDDEVLLKALENARRRLQSQAELDAGRGEIARRIQSLSQRERQVLDGLVAGKANKVIANEFNISPRTVEVYRANLMTKMQAGSLSELVRMALQAAAKPVA
jgi:two-component system response regulator FixJ